MEKFNGNGAECMVRFIADGCKGKVTVDVDGAILVDRDTWAEDAHHATWRFTWLVKPCTYYAPEPVWREVLQPKAYADCLAGIQVQAQHASEPEEWYNVDLCDNLWKTRGIYRFRVLEA